MPLRRAGNRGSDFWARPLAASWSVPGLPSPSHSGGRQTELPFAHEVEGITRRARALVRVVTERDRRTQARAFGRDVHLLVGRARTATATAASATFTTAAARAVGRGSETVAAFEQHVRRAIRLIPRGWAGRRLDRQRVRGRLGGGGVGIGDERLTKAPVPCSQAPVHCEAVSGPQPAVNGRKLEPLPEKCGPAVVGNGPVDVDVVPPAPAPPGSPVLLEPPVVPALPPAASPPVAPAAVPVLPPAAPVHCPSEHAGSNRVEFPDPQAYAVASTKNCPSLGRELRRKLT